MVYRPPDQCSFNSVGMGSVWYILMPFLIEKTELVLKKNYIYTIALGWHSDAAGSIAASWDRFNTELRLISLWTFVCSFCIQVGFFCLIGFI